MGSSNVQEGLRQLSIIFFALLAGQLLFAGVVFYLTSTVAEPSYFLGEQEDLLAVGAYAVAMYFIARFMGKIRNKSISATQKVGGDKLRHYRSSVIIRLALLEGATLFVITVALVTKNPQLLLLCIPLFLGFYAFRPSEDEFIRLYD